MTSGTIVEKIAAEVKTRFEGEGTGHDWWHMYRVWKMAERLGREESADPEIVALGALLHDIADWKFHGGDESAGPREARAMLEKEGVPEATIAAVCDIIAHISFKGAAETVDRMHTIEGKVVQDADRLDAIGAIGIARTFAYGGYKGRPLYDPERPFRPELTKEEYMNGGSQSTVNHFYEKLLLLKDRLHTAVARKIAGERHRFMEDFLSRFYDEWEGKR
jgi:uncharacterized protein